MKLRYRKAVFILPYAKTKRGIEYLLLKRKLHWHGWEFAKGKIEKGEQKVETARRELKEETGHRALKIKKFNYSGKYNYDRILPDRPEIKGQTFSLFAAEIKRKGKVSLDKKEHNGHKWVDFKTALKMLKFSNQKKSLKMVNSWLRGK
ncbi:MAG: NUDIX domain-containing protein [Nanoarchaeota archaeon]|nr:NUDIX domain-containing protein [Nanoarchaeota archaeon]